MKGSKGWYYCVQYEDADGLITEAGNQAERVDILKWIIENVDKLPSGDGKIVKKRVMA